ncbi:hypothetical protein LCGC14_2180560, partial [marine sediment metagenome]
YTEPGSPTFLNGSASARAAYPMQTPGSQAKTGTENLQKGNILSYMEQVNKDAGIGVQERSQLLARTLKGKRTHNTTTEYYNAEGEQTGKTVTRKTITPNQVATLIDLANRTEGLYNKAGVAEHIAKREYDDRIKELRASVVVRRRGEGG